MLINRMRFCIVLFYLVCMIALSTAGKKDENVHEEEYKGGHKPYERDLSDKEHHEDDEEMHNPAFDHEAFLGKEESEKFDHLDPEESKQRLGELVPKIDKNGDKKISEEELKEWIQNVSKNSIKEDAKRQFEALSPKTKEGKVLFETYSSQTLGKPEKKDMDEHFKETLAREQRKWKVADTDGDGALSLEEFTAFIHPEEAPHMRDIVIEEAMADMDKDKDGYISLEEYINDLWQPTENEKEEPSWLKTEREAFSKKHDKNGDGRLDLGEVSEWLIPKDFDHSSTEAKHLISKADTNNDGVLTKEEILNNHDLFAGSQATDFGAALNRHEEL